MISSRQLHLWSFSGAIILAVVSGMGCRFLQPMPGEEFAEFTPVQNPLTVPMVPRALVMDEVSDEIDNYFRIVREERVRMVEGVLTEGWIETLPRVGATILEPWRGDSVPGFELAHASLQTVRRFAKVRIIPTGNSYLIDLKVYKELEDLDQPQAANIRGTWNRHDNSLDADRPTDHDQPDEKGWIPMGRDMDLENVILKNIQSRLNTVDLK